MALDFKSVASNQFASRSNRAVQAGLKKVSGNILGSALGTTSPSTAASLSNFSLGFADSGPFSTKMLSFPSDVATDPRQVHYINFSIPYIFNYQNLSDLSKFCPNISIYLIFIKLYHGDILCLILPSIFIYSYMHIFMYSYINAFIFSYIHMFIYLFIHMRKYSYIHTLI